METNISNAFVLLVIGMTTVFLILSLVVIAGNLLIKVVNRYSVEEVVHNKFESARAIQPEILAAITAVVDTVTQGNGVVEHIEKLD